MATMANLYVDVAARFRDFDKMTENVRSIEQQCSGLVTTVKNVGTAMASAFVVTKVLDAGKAFIDLAGNLTDLSSKTGVGVEALQALKYAAEQNGGSLEGVTGAIVKMGKSLAEGDTGAVKAIGQLGLSFDALRTMKPEDAFIQIGEAIGGVKDPMAQAKLATELFGKAGVEQLPMFNSHLKETVEQAGQMGLVMSEDVVAAGDAFGDSLGQLMTAGMALLSEVIGPFLPLLQQLAEIAIIAAKAFGTVLGDAITVVVALGKEAVTWIVDTATKVYDFAMKIPGVSTVIGAMGTAFGSVKEYATGLHDKIGQLNPKVDTSTEAMKRNKPAIVDVGTAHGEAAKQAAAHDKAIQGLTEKLGGAGAIQKAKDYAEALTHLPGLQTLTKDKQIEVARAMEEAIATYKAAGLEIPEQFKLIDLEARAWSKTMTEDVAAEMKATATALAEPFKNFKLPHAEMRLESRPLQLKMAEALVPVPADVSAAFSNVKNPITGSVETFYKGVSITGSTSMLSGMNELLSAQLGPTIIGALQGGGDVAGSVAGLVGEKLGANLVEKAGGWLTSTFGDTLGKTFGSMIPGLGAMLGPLTSAVVGFFKNMFGTAGRDAVLEFANTFGGFDPMHQQLLTLGAAGEELWVKLTQGVGRNNPAQAKAVIEEITKAFDAQKASVEALRTEQNTQLGDLLGQLENLKGRIPETLGVYIDKLTEANLLTEDNATLLATLRGEGELDWKKMEDVAKKYGIALEGLGPQFQSSKLHAGAQELWDDYQLLIQGGGDVGAVLDGMSGSIGKLVTDSLKFGVDIPDNFRPLIQNLIDADKLILDNGTHVRDINTLKFGTSIQTSIEALITKIGELIDKMIGPNGVTAAIGKIPSTVGVVVDIERRFRDTGADAEVFHSGIESVQRFHSGTARVLPFVVAHNGLAPDEVPAVLQTGEAVLNRRAAAAVGTPTIGALNRGDRPSQRDDPRFEEMRREFAAQRVEAMADREFLRVHLPKAFKIAIQQASAGRR